MTEVSMTVNGKAAKADIPDNTLLVEYIREHLRLTGTHVGCDTSRSVVPVLFTCKRHRLIKSCAQL